MYRKEEERERDVIFFLYLSMVLVLLTDKNKV
jgi:hypothetical protein